MATKKPAAKKVAKKVANPVAKKVAAKAPAKKAAKPVAKKVTVKTPVKKVANTNEGNSNDPTTSKKPLAQTGEKTYIVVGILAIVSAFGLYRFKKVKN